MRMTPDALVGALRRLPPLRSALLLTHAILVLAIGVALGSAVPEPWLRIGVLVVIVVPLVMALAGLWRGRLRTFQWLAIGMVLIAGLSATEVVATQERAGSSTLILLCSLLELALLYVSTRSIR